MSRCGSCPLYWPSDDADNYGVTCKGDEGVEECASNLQSLIFEMQMEMNKTRINSHDRLVISAYTGFLMCDFNELHKFIERTLGRPVFTHELAAPDVLKLIQEKLKPEWLAICGANPKGGHS